MDMKHLEAIEEMKANLRSVAVAIGSIAELDDEYLQEIAEAISSAGKTLDDVSVASLGHAIRRLWDVGMDLSLIDFGGLFYSHELLPPHPDDASAEVAPAEEVPLRPDGKKPK